ncbi:MAG: secondary thiamine-phosphate synthase enzyme YjbQ [Methanosarcina sp.]|nr:secondary thiamine-phosphate synthase enzyme YjbQ [Methanosarcina sp.]MDD4523891.1 secondary thiamine-phosphate synthase enzyme YjbQ [Methanosarcina sp.]
MPVETREISVIGKEDCGIVNITEIVSEKAQKSKIRNGTITIFCIGSTGAITTMEFESNLSKDVAETLDKLIPLNKDYHHHETWGDYNGGSHLRSLLIGPSLTVPVVEKRLTLGIWQQIVYINFDRTEKVRKIVLQIIGEF